MNNILHFEHDFGFFSNCTIALCMIIRFCYQNKFLPILDCSKSFTWYKQYRKEYEDVFYDFFKKKNSNSNLNFNIEFNECCQYDAYKHIQNIENIIQYVAQFFSPHDNIMNIVEYIENKYKINYHKTCVLFYRGNDKKREMFSIFSNGQYTSYYICGKYTDLVTKAKELESDDTVYIIQSDETQFIQYCKSNLENCIVFEDEIRHMKENIHLTVDVLKYDNYKYAKYFLAIIIVMAKCNNVISTTGNISLWIYFYRYIYNKEKITNFHHYFKGEWL